MSLKLPICQQLSVLGPWMLSSPMNSGCAVFASQSVSLCIRRSCFPQITNFTDSSFFYQMPSRVFCVFNFYNGNSTLKRWLVWYRYVQYFCYVGATQHKQHLMKLRFQFQENCQRYLLRSYTTKANPIN